MESFDSKYIIRNLASSQIIKNQALKHALKINKTKFYIGKKNGNLEYPKMDAVCIVHENNNNTMLILNHLNAYAFNEEEKFIIYYEPYITNLIKTNNTLNRLVFIPVRIFGKN